MNNVDGVDLSVHFKLHRVRLRRGGFVMLAYPSGCIRDNRLSGETAEMPSGSILKTDGIWLVLILSLLVTHSTSAAENYAPPGTRVVATPTGVNWEECTVIEPIPSGRAYYLDCASGDYTVGIAHVQDRTPESLRLTLPPSSKPGMPQVGDTVLASPLGLEDQFETCRIIQDLTAQGAYGVACPSGEWVVGMRWVKPAPEATAAIPTAPKQEGAARPAAPATLSRPPAPPATAITNPEKVSTPVKRAPSSEPIRPIANQRVIASGIYLAPVGGSLEVLQIHGGLIALNPRTLLSESTFSPANAARVGTLELQADQLIVNWSDGTRRTGSFKIDDNCLIWSYIYCKAAPFERNAKLVGTYVGSATAGGGTVSSSTTLSFAANGAYELAATGAMGAPSGTSGAAASARTERGRFRIDGWLLRLESESGATREYLSFPYEIYAPLDPIYFNGGFLRLR